MKDFIWLNEPQDWNVENGVLTLTTEANTDFWQTTFYGFRRHSGHARLQPVSGDFSASVAVRGDYHELYDQAGLMLSIDETHWLKTGIEFTDGLMHFSVVVTNGTSDWSVIPLPHAQPDAEVHIRLTRHDAAVRVQFHLGNGVWQMARLCPFSDRNAQIGVMACSPEREGFTARFEAFTVGPAISRDLHTA
ncbi:regulation of enolase protein 1 (concanavalin A-like superfamily) [Ensifer sp. 4252]